MPALRDLIQLPLVTEKTTQMRSKQGKYCFRVHPSANKLQITKAIQEIFNVRVDSIRTQNVLGKPKRMGRFIGVRPNWKKAIVKLKSGDTIKIFEGE